MIQPRPNFLPYVVAICLSLLVLIGHGWSSESNKQPDIAKCLNASGRVFGEAMATPQEAIPAGIIENAMGQSFRLTAQTYAGNAKRND
jgi:hypothetical protein